MVTTECDELTLHAIRYGLLPAWLCAEQMHPDDLAAIIAALGNAVRVQSPWLSAAEAAEYLRCKVSRVRKLTSTGDLPVERDGSRVLYHREALDEFVRNGGAISP